MNKAHLYLIGIAGGSASGKTFFLESLRNNFSAEELCIISQDDYYYPVENQAKDANGMVNYDLPGAINDSQFLQDLHRLSNGETLSLQEYVFNNPEHDPKIKYISFAPVIVVEGLFVLHFKEIRNLFDLKIFIDAREDIKLARRMKRDETERAIPLETIRYQWQNHVLPAYNEYLLPYRDDADIILTNNLSIAKGLEVISHHIRAKLNEIS